MPIVGQSGVGLQFNRSFETGVLAFCLIVLVVLKKFEQIPLANRFKMALRHWRRESVTRRQSRRFSVPESLSRFQSLGEARNVDRTKSARILFKQWKVIQLGLK